MADTLAPLRDTLPEVKSGQQVRVHQKISEGDKERTQVFEGLVLKRTGGKGPAASITVRKIGAGGIGVERIFPMHSPVITKIEVVAEAKTRRANLSYLRNPRAKQLKMKSIGEQAKK